jgi:hypothetical protein
MLQLELSKATATLEKVNLRTEKSGPDKVPAADLKLSCPQDAGVLAHFSPTLRSFLFGEAGPKDLADGVRLRDPHMQYPLARDEEMTGVTLHVGFGPGKPMKLEDCKVNAFKLTPMDGGRVIVGFRVQCRPTPEQVAKLYQLQETGVEITLEPAELPEMGKAA